MDTTRTYNMKLVKYRSQTGLTLTEFASACRPRLSRITIHRFENGDYGGRETTKHIIVNTLKRLGVTTDEGVLVEYSDIFGGKNE